MLKVAKDYFLTFLYVFFKIMGLLPFYMRNKDANNSAIVFSYSLMGLLYNIFLTCLIAYFSFGAVRALIYDVDYEYKSDLGQLILTIKAVGGTVILLFSWLFIAIKQKKAIDLAKRFANIDKALMELRFIYKPNFTSYRVPLYFGLHVIFWINSLCLHFIQYEEYTKSTFAAELLPGFIFSWYLLQYSFVFISLESRFHALNGGLQRLAMTTSMSSALEISSEESITRDFRVIKNIHKMLYDISCDACDLYSLPVLLMVPYLWGTIVYISYYSLIPFLTGTQDIEFVLEYYAITYVIMDVYYIATMSHSVTKMTSEMITTPDVVHQFLAQSIVNRELKYELKLFSLELLHRQRTFTACDIFPIDCTLLHSIFSATVTYLVILIQFQLNEKLNDSKRQEYLHYRHVKL